MKRAEKVFVSLKGDKSREEGKSKFTTPISGQHTTCREITTTVHFLQFLEKNRMESYNQFLLVKISQISEKY
jgi:hypothetical protein